MRRAYSCAGNKPTSSKTIVFSINTENLSIPPQSLKPTYGRIRQWVLENYGLNVSTLYVAEMKDKLGLTKQYKYRNKAKRRPQCPKDKADAIAAAFAYYGLK